MNGSPVINDGPYLRHNFNSSDNKKVLLRNCKRRTVCCVSWLCRVLSRGWEGRGKGEGSPVLARGREGKGGGKGREGGGRGTPILVLAGEGEGERGTPILASDWGTPPLQPTPPNRREHGTGGLGTPSPPPPWEEGLGPEAGEGTWDQRLVYPRCGQTERQTPVKTLQPFLKSPRKTSRNLLNFQRREQKSFTFASSPPTAHKAK